MEKAWQTKARDLHFGQGLPPSEVATQVGYSLETVRKFLTREKKALGKTGERIASRSKRSYEGKKPLSKNHAHIGARLSRYRFNQPETMTAEALGSILGTSRNRVREMELGFHDFTLSECDRIAKLLNVPMSELIKS